MDSINWVGVLLGSLLAICAIAILAIIFAGLFWMANHAFRPQRTIIATVTGKTFTPEHMQMSGKIMVTVPDTWEMSVECSLGEDSVEVSEAMFDELNEGEHVQVLFDTGRINGSFNLREVLGPSQ